LCSPEGQMVWSSKMSSRWRQITGSSWDVHFCASNGWFLDRSRLPDIIADQSKNSVGDYRSYLDNNPGHSRNLQSLSLHTVFETTDKSLLKELINVHINFKKCQVSSIAH